MEVCLYTLLGQLNKAATNKYQGWSNSEQILSDRENLEYLQILANHLCQRTRNYKASAQEKISM